MTPYNCCSLLLGKWTALGLHMRTSKVYHLWRWLARVDMCLGSVRRKADLLANLMGKGTALGLRLGKGTALYAK